MITQIVVHLLPQEIDWFEWQSKQLKQGSYYLEEDDEIIIDVTLNLNLIDWDKSETSKEFFINKFHQIKKLFSQWAKTQFIVDEENKCLGCNDKRRTSIRNSTSDNIIYLDTDLVFKPETLKYIIQAANSVEEELYIISPQLIKMWDNSWDILVNSRYINDIPNLENYHSKDPYEIISYPLESINLSPIEGFKFGGGWFNLFSTKLLQTTDIPNSLGPYGVDDTFVMHACNILKQKQYNIKQYILEGIIVKEDNKYRFNVYKNLLHVINKQKEFRSQAENNLKNELISFSKKY